MGGTHSAPGGKADNPAVNKDEVLAWLAKNGTRRTIDGTARYGIKAAHADGVPMAALIKLAKRIGTNHELSLALWDSGRYEARLLASLIGDASRLTGRQMDAWAKSFENWGDCDTACFKLFDRSPLAPQRAVQWSKSAREFEKRGGFALMACVALHDKKAPDRVFLGFLPHLERGARDDRNFVMKGVSWALCAIARRNAKLHAAARETAERLAASKEASRRWIGKDVLRKSRRKTKAAP